MACLGSVYMDWFSNDEIKPGLFQLGAVSLNIRMPIRNATHATQRKTLHCVRSVTETAHCSGGQVVGELRIICN